MEETSPMMLIVFLIMYAYMAYCIQIIGKKSGVSNSWLAWVPVAQVIIMIQAAKKSIWWFLLTFIPLVNLVIYVRLWSNMAHNRGMNRWWHGLFSLIPGVNFISMGYIAFAKSGSASATPPAPTTPQQPVV